MGSSTRQQTELDSERAWLQACREDPAAFEPVFNKYYDAIFNYALRRTANATLAQDIAASTFLKALDNIKDFKWRAVPLATWLYRIATNEINLHYRKHKRFSPLTQADQMRVPDDQQADSELLRIEQEMVQNAKYRRTVQALHRLSVKYQAVLSLRYFEEKSIKEIADILELPVNTVKTQIRRALVELRKQL